MKAVLASLAVGVFLTLGGCVLVAGGGATSDGAALDVSGGDPGLDVNDSESPEDTVPGDAPLNTPDSEEPVDVGNGEELDFDATTADASNGDLETSEGGGGDDVSEIIDLTEPDAGTCLDQEDVICVPGETETKSESCGNCGMKSQSRTCTDLCEWGAWTDWGPCEGQGPCVPGEVTQGGCSQCAQSTCNDSCEWDPCVTNPGFAEDCCFKWNNNGTLQKAVNEHACVEIQEGTFVVAEPVIMPPNHAVRGKGMDKTTVTVNQTEWEITPFEAVIGTFYQGIKVRDLEIDGKGVATYAMGAVGMEIDNCRMKNLRCSAIGAAGPGMVVRNSEMYHIAHPTPVPGKGDVGCDYLPPGVELGAAIYSEGQASNWAPVIENNLIWDIYGPALDVNGAWGGTFVGNQVWDIIGWSAVGLYGASHWTIENNVISMVWQKWTNIAHPYCEGGPGGKWNAAIWLCQDEGADAGLTTNYNKIINNTSISYYGILSIGKDEGNPWDAPRMNTFIGNNVMGSQVGCADDFKPEQWFDEENEWSDNNCMGEADTPPTYF